MGEFEFHQLKTGLCKRKQLRVPHASEAFNDPSRYFRHCCAGHIRGWRNSRKTNYAGNRARKLGFLMKRRLHLVWLILVVALCAAGCSHLCCNGRNGQSLSIRDIEVISTFNNALHFAVEGNPWCRVTYAGCLREIVSADDPLFGIDSWCIDCDYTSWDEQGEAHSNREYIARVYIEGGVRPDAIVVCTIKGVTISVCLEEGDSLSEIDRKLKARIGKTLKEMLKPLTEIIKERPSEGRNRDRKIEEVAGERVPSSPLNR